MRRLAAILLALGGCTLDMAPEEHILRGYSTEELEAGPGTNELKAAIISDVRNTRFLDLHLAEGVSSCSGFKYEGPTPKCALDGTEIMVFDLRRDQADQVYRIEETAYYCPKESVYYYHYEGGLRKQDVWMGPYEIKRSGKKLEDYKN